MDILFGTYSSIIKYFKLKNCACQNCKNTDTLIGKIYGKVFHVFFIPVFPLTRKVILECCFCYKTYTIEDLSEDDKNELEKQNLLEAKTPFLA